MPGIPASSEERPARAKALGDTIRTRRSGMSQLYPKSGKRNGGRHAFFWSVKRAG